MESYVVNLTSVKGNGEIRCPKCGAEISPDDETDEVFTIAETVMKGDNLEKLILKCNKCGSQIHLTGFELLEEIGTQSSKTASQALKHPNASA